LLMMMLRLLLLLWLMFMSPSLWLLKTICCNFLGLQERVELPTWIITWRHGFVKGRRKFGFGLRPFDKDLTVNRWRNIWPLMNVGQIWPLELLYG
jgi:hypothetical protein